MDSRVRQSAIPADITAAFYCIFFSSYVNILCIVSEIHCHSEPVSGRTITVHISAITNMLQFCYILVQIIYTKASTVNIFRRFLSENLFQNLFPGFLLFKIPTSRFTEAGCGDFSQYSFSDIFYLRCLRSLWDLLRMYSKRFPKMSTTTIITGPHTIARPTHFRNPKS